MDWKDWILLILGAAVFAVIGGVLIYNIHKLKEETKADMRKKLHGDGDESAEEHKGGGMP